MQPILLADLLTVFPGKIICGDKNLIISSIAVNCSQSKKSCLLFYFSAEQINCLTYNRFAIITENPSLFNKNIIKKRQITLIKTENIAASYNNFIVYYRNMFDIPVIGITGTCGKTTTVEMIKALNPHLKLSSTLLGRNLLRENLVYLLSIDFKTDAGIFELGVSHHGCITASCHYFQPTIGVLLNIDVYHLRGCLTMENYIKAKAELLSALPENGILVINGDDARIKQLNFKKFKGTIISFGLHAGCDYRLDSISQNIRYKHHSNNKIIKQSTSDGRNTGKQIIIETSFTLHHENTSRTFTLPLLGTHNVYNAAAAIICSGLLPKGKSSAFQSKKLSGSLCPSSDLHSMFSNINNMEQTENLDCSLGPLSSFSCIPRHLQLKKGINNCLIIDDSWNCTPLSMIAALNVLQQLTTDLPLVEQKTFNSVAVLGEMQNLGQAGYQQYSVIGEQIAGQNIDRVILLGHQASLIGRQAIKAGYNRQQLFCCLNAGELFELMQTFCSPQSIILLKIPYTFLLSRQEQYRDFMSKIIKQANIKWFGQQQLHT